MESMATPGWSLSILLVEDEKATLNLLTNILRKKYPACALHTAINGGSGLELFQRHMTDIVITDLNMPGMNGVQMTENIRAVNPKTKFIILTGDAGEFSLEASIEEGFDVDHFITKPISFNKLFAAIEHCFGESLTSNL